MRLGPKRWFVDGQWIESARVWHVTGMGSWGPGWRHASWYASGYDVRTGNGTNLGPYKTARRAALQVWWNNLRRVAP